MQRAENLLQVMGRKKQAKHPFILTVALIEAESGQDVQSYSRIYTKSQKSNKQIKQKHSQSRNRVSCAFLDITGCASWLLILESSHFVLFTIKFWTDAFQFPSAGSSPPPVAAMKWWQSDLESVM